MKKPKRMTPADDQTGELALVWAELHRYNTEELGLSNRQSWYNISDTYNCSWHTARYHTDKNFNLSTKKRARTVDVPYSKMASERLKYKRMYMRTYNEIKNNPDIYLEEALSDIDTPLSMDNITDKLSSLTGITFRNSTLLKVIRNHEKKYGAPIFQEIGDEPLYRLV